MDRDKSRTPKEKKKAKQKTAKDDRKSEKPGAEKDKEKKKLEFSPSERQQAAEASALARIESEEESSDGTNIRKGATEATYLGATITAAVGPKREIRKRITAAMGIHKRLDTYWLKAQCNRKWKLLVHDAVIASKVLIDWKRYNPRQQQQDC